jgi:MscS family membrane protein
MSRDESRLLNFHPELNCMKKSALPMLIVVLIIALAVPNGTAQSISGLLKGKPAQTAGTAATDQLGRNTPSGTVLGFLEAEQNGNEVAAADYLQMSSARRQSQGTQLAGKLKLLMDRAFVGRLSRISANPEGNPDFGGPDQQTIGEFSAAESEVPVVLVRVTDPNFGRIWLFSAETLSKVPDLYDTVQAHQVESKLPRSLVRNELLGLPLWQWLALIAAIPVAVIIGLVVVLLLNIPRRLYLRYKKQPDLHTYGQLSRPLLLCFSAIAHGRIASYLGLPLLPRFYYSRTMWVLVSSGFFWFVLRIATLIMQRLRMHAVAIGRTGTGSLMLLGERLTKALVVIIAILAVLAICGFNLTTVLAGLGIGGIAIALAAQKTLENLFGGISVLADEVIRVGDYCKFGDRSGTVEDISLRSTRIRTDDRTQLSIPNGAVATMNVENLSRRDKFLWSPSLNVRPETSPDQLRYLLAEIRKLLYAHPKVEPTTIDVRLAAFGASAYTVGISSYITTLDNNEFTAVREDLLLRVIEIVERSGTGLAFPAQTLYLGRDAGLDREKTAAAERQVEQWRDQHDLPFPDLTADEKASLRGTIPYPVPESAMGKKPA